ncbi:MAG: quinate 5-dehydrogenase [Chloroflexi bacterium]|nr:MAG: quinate 5-dehydrogenase [Chloroflexota bacterium]MCQ3939095.1 quinate 5-dehydrogenase [Chloroflexota bacterium]MDL1942844.1 quinate 5-dehydrogenase [Chloroflexi bacterium CFX2]
MKHAVSISLGSSKRDKKVIVNLNGVEILVERIGTDGDIAKARQMYLDLDGKVDAFGVGGVDLFLRLDQREYPLHAALKLVAGVKQTPLCDGRGLKHTLERRVFELAKEQIGEVRFKQAFIPVAVDRLGLAQAVSEVSERCVFGDLMVALGVPLPIYGLPAFKRVARMLLPIVSHFPMNMIFYGSDGAEHEPRYVKYFEESDLIAGDFLFMRKYMPKNLSGKTIVTNTTTEDNIALLKERGVKTVITTTPRYDGRSFGTNATEAMLTAYAGKGRRLTDEELNGLIDELGVKPGISNLN